jgi:DNA-binding NarL/FixJ family response regulator
MLARAGWHKTTPRVQRTYVCSVERNPLVNAASTIAPRPTRKPLTRRELEVLELIAGGLSNKEIAIRLCLSTETVKSHVRVLLPKLGANSRAHAVAIALRQGLLR